VSHGSSGSVTGAASTPGVLRFRALSAAWRIPRDAAHQRCIGGSAACRRAAPAPSHPRQCLPSAPAHRSYHRRCSIRGPSRLVPGAVSMRTHPGPMQVPPPCRGNAPRREPSQSGPGIASSAGDRAQWRGRAPTCSSRLAPHTGEEWPVSLTDGTARVWFIWFGQGCYQALGIFDAHDEPPKSDRKHNRASLGGRVDCERDHIAS
jgi:hypothetical protein